MTIDKFLDSINDETTAQEIMSMFRNLNYMNKIEVILYHHDELGLPVDAVFVAMYLRQFRPIIPAWMSLDNESSRSIQETLSGVREVEINTVSDVEERILRKGAVSAKNGELLLIPVNMRDGSILAVGRGNPEWNDSAPHGAGRIMSRMEAKRTLDLEEYRRAMEGIYTTSVNEHTLDEAPMVYKSLEEILETVAETVDIVDLMKPVYNFKFHGWHRNAAEEKTEDVHD